MCVCVCVPSLQGQSLFQGTQVHSFGFMDPSAAYGKSVLVVGGSKEALQAAALLARKNVARRLVVLAPEV